MLGKMIHDPVDIESEPGSSAGSGLLQLETIPEAEKQLRNIKGSLLLDGSSIIYGYEIHTGVLPAQHCHARC